MIISENNIQKVELDNDIVIKTFKGAKDIHGHALYNNQLGDVWFDRYKKYREIVPSICEVYEVTPNRIVMEYVKGEPVIFRTCTKKELNAVLLYYYELMRGSLTYYIEYGHYFVHGDMNPTNMLLQTRDVFPPTGSAKGTKKELLNLRLIEPDGFFRHARLDLNNFIMNQMRFSTRLMYV
jgi:hypothetical protein